MIPLQTFIEEHARLFVLTGAGCSTDSGIPDYRDADGQWKRKPPVTFQAFMGDPAARQRYWARSLIGWRSFGPGPTTPTARWPGWRQGKSEILLTQNVDGLHQAAGSRR